jgi:hypothetical protein
VRNTVFKLPVSYVIIMSSNDVLQSYFLLSSVCIHRPERTDLWKSSWNMTGIKKKKMLQDLHNHDNLAIILRATNLRTTNLQMSVQRI